MVCSRCGEDKELNLFPKGRKYCKKCHSKQCMESAKKHPLTAIRTRTKNAEKIKERRRLYKARPEIAERNSLYFKNWYEQNGRKRAENYGDIIQEWVEKNPEKVSASKLVNDLVKEGKITKPEKCEMCSRTTRLSGHHQDYSKPAEVIWLCGSCHKRVHLGLLEIKL